jgi:hypothetical protein
MELRTPQHEVCTGLTALGTVHQQFDMGGFSMMSSLLKAIADGVKANAMAI